MSCIFEVWLQGKHYGVCKYNTLTMSLSYELSTVISGLSSSKLRERNDSLRGLNSILKDDPTQVPVKLFANLIDSLIEIIESEKVKYSIHLNEESPTNKVTLCKERLSSAAYSLRLFIEKKSESFKAKHIKTLSSMLFELMFLPATTNLIAPIAEHLSFSLTPLCSSPAFRLNFELHHWILLVQNIANCLTKQFESRSTDKCTLNFLQALLFLVELDTIGIREIGGDVIRTLLEYFTNFTNETTNTKLVMHLTNTTIIKLHLYRLHDIISVAHGCMRHILNLSLSNEELCNTISQFNFLSSELVFNHAPFAVGEDKTLSHVSTEDIFNAAKQCLVHQLNHFDVFGIKLECLNFGEMTIKDEANLFHLHDMSLNPLHFTSSSKGWIRLLSIAKLLKCYFALLEAKENSSAPVSILYKRQKIGDTFSTILEHSFTPSDFLCNCLETSSFKIRLASLQIALFFLTTSNFRANDIEDIKISLFAIIQDPKLSPWACACLIPLCSQAENNSSMDEEIRIMKICLPLLKLKGPCNIACALLSKTIQFQQELIQDDGVLQQIYDIYEMSDVQGPSIISEEAFSFWKYIHHYAVDRNSTRTSLHNIFTWIYSHWSELTDALKQDNAFVSFIWWTFGSKKEFPKECVRASPRWFTKWKNTETERLHVTLTRRSKRKEKVSKRTPGLMIPELSENARLIYRVIETMNSAIDYHSFLNWSIFLTKILEVLVGEEGYSMYVSQFEEVFTSRNNTIQISSPTELLEVIERLPCLGDFILKGIILDAPKVKDISLEYKTCLMNEINVEKPGDEFLSVRPQSFSHTMFKDNIPAFVSFILTVFSVNSKINDGALAYFLDFAEELPNSLIIDSVNIVVDSILTSSEVLSLRTVERITQFLGASMLSSEYNTSSISMEILSKYLRAISSYWVVENSTSFISGDCNDILEWIIARYNDISFSEIGAFKELSNLLIHLLQNFSLSTCSIQGGKQRIFQILTSCFDRLPPHEMSKTISQLGDYVQKLSVKNQVALFDELMRQYPVPQQTIECSAFYTFLCATISSFNDFYLNITICHMLSNTTSRHLLHYIERCLDLITTANKFQTKKELFQRCKFAIFKYWVEKSSSLNAFDDKVWEVGIFEYNFDSFLHEYRKEIAAFSFALNFNCSLIIESLCQSSGLKAEQLMNESLHLMIPLSFTRDGAMNAIFDIGYQQLGKKFTSIMKSKVDEILYWFLKFTDLSNGKELSALWQKAFPNSLFSECVNTKGFAEIQPSFRTTVNFGASYKIIRKTLLESGDLELCFKYCIDRLIVDLEESKLRDHQIKIIREIKFLFLLFESKNIKIHNPDRILLELSYCLDNENIHSEAISLNLDLLSIWSSKVLIMNKSLLFLFRVLIRKIGVMSQTDKALLAMLDPNNFNYAGPDCSGILAVAYNLLSGKERYLKFEDIKTILGNDILCDEVLFLLSDLFENYSNSATMRFDYKISKDNAKKFSLISSSSSKLSNKFIIWYGTLLGNFYADNACYCSDIKGKDEFIMSNGMKGLLLTLLERRKGGGSIKLTSMLENALSILMTDSIISQDVNLFNCEIDGFIPLTYLTVEKFFNIYGELDQQIEQLPNKLPCIDMKYADWLLWLNRRSITLLADFFPKLEILLKICVIDTQFSELVLLRLVELLVSKVSKQKISFIADIFNSMALLSDSYEGKCKIQILIKIYCKIRAHYLKDIDANQFLYALFDQKVAIDAAVRIGCSITALMLFEDFNGKAIAEGSEVDSSQLTSVYSLLNNKDFQYAIPVNQSPAFSLTHLSKTRFNPHSKFMFNNASYDQSIRSRGNLHPPPELTAAVSGNGFFGLSSILNRLSHEEIHDDSYAWCLKLSKWNLPVPEKPNTLLKTSYAILKEIKNLRDNRTCFINLQIQKAIKNVSRSNVEQSQRLTLLFQLKICENATNIFDCLKKIQDSEVSNLDNIDGRLLDIVQWTRNYYLQFKSESFCQLNEGIMGFEYHVARIWSLSHQCDCARIQKRSQDLMNGVLMLNEAVSGLQKFKALEHFDALSKSCHRISVLQSARMLWVNGESSVPLTMLEELVSKNLSEVEDNQKSNFGIEIFVPDIVIDRQLVDWASISKNRSPEVIFREHILKFDRYVSNFSDYNERSSICFAYGNFCYKESQKFDDTQIQQLSAKIERYEKELLELSRMYKNAKLKESERKDAKRHFNRLSLQRQQDKERFSNLTKSRTSFVFQALHFYLTTLVHSNQRDDEVIDKFCSLWFQYSDDLMVNTKLQKEIGTIPSFKFLPWVNQMVSKLSNDSSPFQETLQLTIKRMLYKLPYETLYPLISMTFSGDATTLIDPSTRSRIEVVSKIIDSLNIYDNGKYRHEYTVPIKEFCSSSMDLASYKLQGKTKVLDLQSLNIGHYWINRLQNIKLPLVTVPIKISSSQDGRNKERPHIVRVDPMVQISSSGLSLPKIVTFVLSDGKNYKVLMKGSNDDLRQDAIMEQVFKQVNNILIANKDTKNQRMRVRTYEVIPLGPQAGIIEFVPNSIPLQDILGELHSGDKLSFDRARKSMKAVQNRGNDERVITFKKIMDKIRPQLRRFYFNSFVDPDEWYACRLRYTKGVVTTSIVGYLLGLGDRHLNNILIDKITGEPIHIDLGVAFDQGKLLPIPELVPFRLTRDMVDAFGVTGVEGIFRINCERVFSVLQDERERLMCVLNILKWDPLYSWKMSPLKKQKLQAQYEENLDDFTPQLRSDQVLTHAIFRGSENENDEAVRALRGVEEKLYGSGLSVEAIVQELIVEATDINNLATIYMGWSPFY